MKYLTSYYSYITEGLSSARKYAEKNNVPLNIFDQLTQGDPTPTKKYLDKMLQWFVVSGIEVGVIIDAVENFNVLVGKNIISGKDSDISSYANFDAFSSVITNNADKDSETRKKKNEHEEEKKHAYANADIILDNDKWFIVRPMNHRASVWFGRNSHWCTSIRNNATHWNDYTRQGMIFYYCTNKLKPEFNYNGGNYIGHPMDLVAIVVYPDMDDSYYAYDGADRRIDPYDFCRENKLDLDLFKNFNQIIKEYSEKTQNTETNIRNILSFMGITDYTINSDNSVDFHDSVEWKSATIPFKIRRVAGTFHINSDKFESLKNGTNIQ